MPMLAQIAVLGQCVARFVGLVLGVVLFGAGVVAALNIELVWGYRLERLAMTAMADDTVSSVTTRVEEYRIAKEHFMQYPVLGNGWGASTPYGSSDRRAGYSRTLHIFITGRFIF